MKIKFKSNWLGYVAAGFFSLSLGATFSIATYKSATSSPAAVHTAVAGDFISSDDELPWGGHPMEKPVVKKSWTQRIAQTIAAVTDVITPEPQSSDEVTEETVTEPDPEPEEQVEEPAQEEETTEPAPDPEEVVEEPVETVEEPQDEPVVQPEETTPDESAAEEVPTTESDL